MKILSIDVGIKNLAFCLFVKNPNSNHFEITKWDVINVSQPETFNCCEFSKNILCNKPAKFKKDLKYFCTKHAKKQTIQIPPNELKHSEIQKKTIQQLYEIAEKYSISYEKPIKKTILLSIVNKYIYDNFFQEITVINASKIDLVSIGTNIKNKFNETFSEDMIEHVIIENQISPIANRMKTIQGMIVQYFIMSEIVVDQIEFVSASNKLKDYDTKDKLNYNSRKKLGIQKCLETISNDHRFVNQVDFFKTHKKKDDLADSFLQGLWYINNFSL